MSTESARTSHATAWFVAVLAAMVLYILSPGPVVAFMASQNVSEPTLIRCLDIIYTPLEWVTDVVPGSRFLLNQYVEWWLETVAKP